VVPGQPGVGDRVAVSRCRAPVRYRLIKLGPYRESGRHVPSIADAGPVHSSKYGSPTAVGRVSPETMLSGTRLLVRLPCHGRFVGGIAPAVVELAVAVRARRVMIVCGGDVVTGWVL
jgi:hypothetical protein